MSAHDDTIERCLTGLGMLPTSDPRRIGLLNAVGLLLYLKYNETKTMTNLQQAVKAAQEVLEVTPPGHPNKQVWLNNLANLLSDNYSATGEMSDLDEAIRGARQAVEATPQGHEDRPMWLNNFGALLNQRYLKTGTQVDNDEALGVSQEAVRITPNEHPELGGRLNNLRVQLGHRYDRTKGMEDLESAIQVARDCVRTTPEQHAGRSQRLRSLALVLDTKYSAAGAMGDLEESIKAAQGSVDVTPPDDSDLGERLNLLGVQLAKRYLRKWEVADLDRAISITQAALSATSGPEDQPRRAGWLNNLAIYFGQRYTRLGALSDLEHAIQASRAAVAKTSEVDSSLPSCLNNLCYLLKDRHSRLQQPRDLDEAISSIRKAISLTPEDHRSQLAALNGTLGYTLGERFLKTKSTTDIDEAVEAGQRAADLTPRDHPDWPRRQLNLASHLGKRSSTSDCTEDLERSIRAAQEAIDTAPEDIPNRATYFNSLAKALFARYLRTKVKADLERVTSCYRSALHELNSPIASRIEAGKSLSSCYAFVSDWQLAFETAKTTLGLIPQLTPRSLKHADKQHLLGQIAGLASDAAAVALQIGEDPLVALEFLEQGRGVLTASLGEMQEDALELKSEHPQLGERFINLRDELEPFVARGQLSTDGLLQPWQAQATRRYDAAAEFDQLLTEIRQQPGFENFLLAPKSDEMLAAAAFGPIVVVNVSTYRCDAIIVEKEQIRSLTLPDLDIHRIESVALEGNLGRPDVLEWLWDTIAEPTLDALGFRELPSGDAWPRLWWIPTGILTKFPPHAAGRLGDDGVTDGVLDRVMSSYSLTIKSLIRGRRNHIPTTVPLVPSKALLVAMQDTPGHITRLPFALKEISMLHNICKSMAVETFEPRRLKSDVLSLLPSCKIFHFAGHANANNFDPSQSKLLLEDWQSAPLTVSSLMETNLHEQSPFLAYLSACGTGQIKDERFVDESIHLISACQLAGYRHVVGTLWEVSDETCVDIAEGVYEGIREKGMTDEAVCWGLHKAARKLRQRWALETAMFRAARRLAISKSSDGDTGDATRPRDIEDGDEEDEKNLYWVPYVHFGV